jgi:lipoate-protein ligase B
MITEALTCVGPDKLRRPDGRAVEWRVTDGLVEYPEALAFMKDRAAAIARGEAQELVWLVEHPPLYTSGTSAAPTDLLQPNRFPVYEAGRGGEYTYHGPGQRVAYLMLDLRERGRDVRCLVQGLEEWIIDTLGVFNVAGERRDGRIGVWVKQPGRIGGESKIAAIGVRDCAQRCAEPQPLRRDRAVWHLGPGRHQPRGSRPDRLAPGGRYRPQSSLRTPFRTDGSPCAGIACHGGVRAPS